MTLWVEIHCDIGRADDEGCLSFNNDNIGRMADNSLSSLTHTMKSLTIEAQRAGWRKRWRRGGTVWVCPACRKKT